MLDTMLFCAAVVGGVATLLWILSVAIKDASIVDIFWGPAFAVIAWSAWWARALPMTVAATTSLALVTTWGLRLGLYLAWRNIGKGEDFRYQKMRKSVGSSFAIRSLVTVFWFQAAIALAVSVPVVAALVAAEDVAVPWIAVGAAIWAIGLFFEAVGDAQLARFKADPDNKGKVMDKGLWRYTRHPNYFGDSAMWWGLYLIIAPVAPWAAVGPVIMTFFLLNVSGVAMLEKTIGKRRPGYAEYVRKTSAFIPWPPKA